MVDEGLMLRDLSFRKSGLQDLNYGKLGAWDQMFGVISFRISSIRDLSSRKC